LAVSLGNLGEKESSTKKIDYRKQAQQVPILCKTGVIGKVNKHGIAMTDPDNYDTYIANTFCDVGMAENESVISKCIGK